MKFEMSFIFEVIKCVHEVILSQCVLDAIRVNMDRTLSVLPIDFYLYRLISRNMSLSEISSLGETFCELPGSMLDKLKRLHSEVFTEVHWGRLLVFLNFVEQLGLTDEEWEQLFDLLVPTLSQIREQLYKWNIMEKFIWASAFAAVTSNGLLAIFTLSAIRAHFQPHSFRFSLLRGSSDCLKL